MPNIWKIIRLAQPLRWWFALLIILVLMYSALSQGVPLISKLIVDEIEKNVTSGDGDIDRLYFLIFISFSVAALSITVQAISSRVGDFVASRLRRDLAQRFYRKIFTLPQRYFDGEISGKIANQLTRGIETIQQFVGGVANFTVPAFLQIFWTVGILAYFNIWVALLTLLIFPLYIAISIYSARLWGMSEVQKNKLEDISRGRIQEVLTNMKLVKVSNTQNQEWTLVSDKLGEVNKIYDKQSFTYHLLNFWRNFGLEIILALIGLIVFVETYNGNLSTGTLILIFQQLDLVRRPLFAMSFIVEAVQRAESGSKEYFEVLDLDSVETLPQSKEDIHAEMKQPNIVFENVAFAYDDKRKVLKDMSFTMDKKETVALVGHSGAGKTTIISLILKLYEPDKGKIFIDGHDYEKMTHQEIRQNIALVFQENELFSSTVRENIAYGVKNATDEQVEKALKKAYAYDFVMKFPDGLDEEIGERGVKLSGGQKQRLQIARAIMQDAPILILDEATSSLDAKSEYLVQQALDNLTEDRLVIMIAHRFSTLQNVDRIIVLNEGEIVDQGTPKELSKRDGIYSELLRYQVEGNAKLLSEYELY